MIILFCLRCFTAAVSSLGYGIMDKGTINFAFTVRACGKWETDLYTRQRALGTNFYNQSGKKLENATYTYQKKKKNFHR